ncbi:MAG TPA: adenosylcobinamide-GDP ribazoletransferase [Intrasporangium sp.]|uniref:adenosylcobinamide-GDP ribazoletransferase n=1 Tax=Intrasporangium sp. TaxID=1925024 RepID=UPI002B489AC6|nr:adenosylcobinamide-GDP ribazoletransferase [Intrasporangium sp.]HKX66620.1 adenosylcobinamide-GDP ribazoletransferase [Intrasporangium sp.]
MRDAWRLSAGTFLVIPVPPPDRVDRAVAGRAMVLAPATAVPAAAVWLGLGVVAQTGWLTPLLAAGLALTATALLSRAMHLDGLADLADGLTSGPGRSRALEVMKRGDTGPGGAVALVLVLLMQAAALAGVLGTPMGTALAVTALLGSRLAPAVACRRGVPPARPDGLGAAVAGTVTWRSLVASALGVLLVGAAALRLAGEPPYAAGFVLVAGAVAAWLVTWHAVRRLGGVTGDVIGAAIEVALVTSLVVAAAVASVNGR